MTPFISANFIFSLIFACCMNCVFVFVYLGMWNEPRIYRAVVKVPRVWFVEMVRFCTSRFSDTVSWLWWRPFCCRGWVGVSAVVRRRSHWRRNTMTSWRCCWRDPPHPTTADAEVVAPSFAVACHTVLYCIRLLQTQLTVGYTIIQCPYTLHLSLYYITLI